MAEWKTNVLTGSALKEMIRPFQNFKRRYLIEPLKDFLYGEIQPMVCGLYGLRRTGKTTMIYHGLLDMDLSDFERSAYIFIKHNNTMSQLEDDLKQLHSSGYRFVFIDEVTSLEDFIDNANVLSDIFATMGMKVVLSGTDSLGFLLSSKDSLFNRINLIHTTYIPFYEFHSLFPDAGLDTYIEYGGTLLKEDDARNPFFNIERTNEYKDSAICRNIQNSLEYYREGREYGRLAVLYHENELTNVFQRAIQQKNRQFLLKTFNGKFKSADFGSANQILQTRSLKQNIQNPMGKLDSEKIRQTLKRTLEILEVQERKISLDEAMLTEANTYLQALDVLIPYDVITYGATITKTEEFSFSQPGLRFSLTKELIDILKNENEFNELSKFEQDMILSTIEHDVKGNLLEEIVLSQAKRIYKTAQPNFSVAQLVFTQCPSVPMNGEFDMAVLDSSDYSINIYEIKYNENAVSEQGKHLNDSNKIDYLQKVRKLNIDSCNVLYMGENKDIDSQGVHYINAEEFLDSFKYLDPNYDRWKEDLDPLRKSIWKELSSYYNGCVSVKKGKPIKLLIDQKSVEQTFDNMTDIVDVFKDKIVQTIQKGSNPFSENLIQFYDLQEMVKGIPNCYELSEESKNTKKQKATEEEKKNHAKKKPTDPDTRD